MGGVRVSSEVGGEKFEVLGVSNELLGYFLYVYRSLRN